ncbi:MAG: bifunctional phosphopantothenoylcysteine decarboxylase/phosphopantothenate--cysteine ligase CoaBC [Polyangiaceae bacterium]
MADLDDTRTSSATRDTAPQLPTLAGKTIVLGVTGSIAAYKAAMLARLFVKEGARVEVVLTERAKAFVGTATFAGISSRPASHDMFDPRSAGETHVSLTARADLVVIAPATADVLARLAQGRADDLLTATALCARSPIVVAPAMHPAMWGHPATQRNVAQLAADGRVTFVGPEHGEVASGEQGRGRMSEPEVILSTVRRLLSKPDLLGRHVVVTAGPTVEDVDPVRFITNRSSGKMGYAIAERAAQRGARVTLVSGPVHLAAPPGVDIVPIRSAIEMQRALDEALGADSSRADALIMSAAVADYRLAEVATTKLKRQRETLTLDSGEEPRFCSRTSERGAPNSHQSSSDSPWKRRRTRPSSNSLGRNSGKSVSMSWWPITQRNPWDAMTTASGSSVKRRHNSSRRRRSQSLPKPSWTTW